MDDTKYVTFPIGAWLDAWRRFPDQPNAEHPLTELQRHRLDDAVVIRTGDVFAAPALDAYAANIATAITVIRSVPFNSDLDKAAEGLQKIADYFHEAALEARDRVSKLPD